MIPRYAGQLCAIAAALALTAGCGQGVQQAEVATEAQAPSAAMENNLAAVDNVQAARNIRLRLQRDGSYRYTTPPLAQFVKASEIGSFGVGRSLVGGTAEITDFAVEPRTSSYGTSLVITFNVSNRKGAPMLIITRAGVVRR